ncbi:Uncharacterised protein [Mycobacteroides abscessus subsp. abscessus]|nr:Uncharacterised protein [Mycobacteroides abscessus subsp. abscessus]
MPLSVGVKIPFETSYLSSISWSEVWTSNEATSFRRWKDSIDCPRPSRHSTTP